MNYLKCIIIFSIIIPSLNSAQNREIVAYLSGYRFSHNNYLIKDLEKKGLANKLTVINYAFARPDIDSLGNIFPAFNHYSAYLEFYSSEMSIDEIADDSNQVLCGNFNQLLKLKRRYPKIRILLSIGGWGGSKYFSDIALTPKSREKFVNACINIFIKGDLPIDSGGGGRGSAENLFDGFDLDWEFPISDGPEGTHYNPNDRQNHTALLALFRKKMDEINPNLLLTAAVSARSWEFWKYNFKEDQNYLDWFNVMTYDYHGSWEYISGHHTNLLSSSEDPDERKESFDNTVKYLLDTVRVSSNKIVPGVAFYGKGWIDVDSVNGGLYQAGIPDTSRAQIRFKNYLDFSDVSNEGFQNYWDDFAMAGWLYNYSLKKFWTYDDIRSVALKARYVDAYNLRGLMFWEITGDDTSYNLINTIYNRNMPDFTNFIYNANSVVPSIKIIKPKSTDKILEGSNVIIKTNVDDTDGCIIKVEFLIDGNSLGYNRITPFCWVWFNALPGEHQVTVTATDNNGNTTSSLPIKINVIKK